MREFKKFYCHGALSFVRFWPRDKKLSQRDPRTRKDLNNKTLWDDRTMFVYVFNIFCLNRSTVTFGRHRNTPKFELFSHFCHFHGMNISL